jgi:hypothetical protein
MALASTGSTGRIVLVNELVPQDVPMAEPELSPMMALGRSGAGTRLSAAWKIEAVIGCGQMVRIA